MQQFPFLVHRGLYAYKPKGAFNLSTSDYTTETGKETVKLSAILHNFGSICMNKDVARKIGLKESIVLYELISLKEYWQNKNELQKGRFYIIYKDLAHETTIAERTLKRIIKALHEMDLIAAETKNHNMKNVVFIKIQEEKCIQLFQETIQNYEEKLEKARSNASCQNGTIDRAKMASSTVPKWPVNNTVLNNPEKHNTDSLSTNKQNKTINSLEIPEQMKSMLLGLLEDYPNELSFSWIKAFETVYKQYKAISVNWKGELIDLIHNKEIKDSVKYFKAVIKKKYIDNRQQDQEQSEYQKMLFGQEHSYKPVSPEFKEQQPKTYDFSNRRVW